MHKTVSRTKRQWPKCSWHWVGVGRLGFWSYLGELFAAKFCVLAFWHWQFVPWSQGEVTNKKEKSHIIWQTAIDLIDKISCALCDIFYELYNTKWERLNSKLNEKTWWESEYVTFPYITLQVPRSFWIINCFIVKVISTIWLWVWR